MRYQFRPLTWTGPSTSAAQRKFSQFKATYPATLDLLFTEIEKLGASQFVLQVDITERDVRTDGLPRANARYGTHPGVIVSFESQHGPLRYATDAFTEWQANLRAIALSIESLRAVDRYGVSRRGEQYTGWKALPSPVNSTRHFATVDEALAWMRGQDDLEGDELPPGALYRKLSRRMHPDTSTGSYSEWNQLDSARQLLVIAEML